MKTMEFTTGFTQDEKNTIKDIIKDLLLEMKATKVFKLTLKKIDLTAAVTASITATNADAAAPANTIQTMTQTDYAVGTDKLLQGLVMGGGIKITPVGETTRIAYAGGGTITFKNNDYDSAETYGAGDTGNKNEMILYPHTPATKGIRILFSTDIKSTDILYDTEDGTRTGKLKEDVTFRVKEGKIGFANLKKIEYADGKIEIFTGTPAITSNNIVIDAFEGFNAFDVTFLKGTTIQGDWANLTVETTLI